MSFIGREPPILSDANPASVVGVPWHCDDPVEEFLRFAWDYFTQHAGHEPGWSWRDRVEALRERLADA